MTDDFKIPGWAKTTVLSPRRWMGLLTTSPNIIRVILPQEHAGKYVMMSSYAGVRLDIDNVSVLVVKTKDVVATFDHLPVTVYPDLHEKEVAALKDIIQRFAHGVTSGQAWYDFQPIMKDAADVLRQPEVDDDD